MQYFIMDRWYYQFAMQLKYSAIVIEKILEYHLYSETNPISSMRHQVQFEITVGSSSDNIFITSGFYYVAIAPHFYASVDLRRDRLWKQKNCFGRRKILSEPINTGLKRKQIWPTLVVIPRDHFSYEITAAVCVKKPMT